METSKEKVTKEKAPPTKPSDMLLDLDDCKLYVVSFTFLCNDFESSLSTCITFVSHLILIFYSPSRSWLHIGRWGIRGSQAFTLP